MPRDPREAEQPPPDEAPIDLTAGPTLAADAAPHDTLSEKAGSVIGPYTLVRSLGEGGFGTVFLAEQESPIRRQVALKIIKLGMDTREVIARFEAEKQALAMMTHSNIARVLDAGATATGRPYFVMELVDGIPITRYCNTNNLSLRERLSLFVQVCNAVQHAHQKGIIHRDLKPSNVLVAVEDGVPVPKVIDFGIAKAAGQGSTDRSVFTELGQFIGTPSYMSPEQAGLDNLDIDTRSDVYSLGVLLYELLTGSVPFDTSTLRGTFLIELQRMIREQDPPKPSTRVVTGAGTRRGATGRAPAESARLSSSLRGDLDWIVMKAIEKSRDRRYDSAVDFGRDIERYLNDEPVAAGPPSASYRLRKFARRHRAGIGVAAAGVLTLVVFAATMAVQARRIAAERDRANREREVAERVAEFQASMLRRIRPYNMGESIVKDLRESIAPAADGGGAGGADRTAALAAFDEAVRGVNLTDMARRILDANILDPAAEAVGSEFASQPETEVRMRLALSTVYRSLGLPAKALPQAERALALCTERMGPEHRDALRARTALGAIYWSLGRLDEAEKTLTEVSRDWERVFGPKDPDGLRAQVSLGVLDMTLDRNAVAESLFVKVLPIQEELLGKDHADVLLTSGNLATIYLNESHPEKAVPLLERGWKARQEKFGREDSQTLFSQETLASAYQSVGRSREAVEIQLEVIEIRTRVFGERHPESVRAVKGLGKIYQAQERSAEAESLFRRTLAMQRSDLGDSHPETIKSIEDLGMLLAGLDRHDEAEPLFREALDRARATFGPDAPPTLDRMGNLAVQYWFGGRMEDAAKLFEEVVEGHKRASGEEDPATIFAMTNLAILYARLGRFEEAQALLDTSLEIRLREFGPEHPLTLATRASLASLAFDRGEYAKAESLYVALRAAQRKTLGDDDPMTLETGFNLGSTYRTRGRDAEAEPVLRETLERQRRVIGPAHSQTVDTIQKLSEVLVATGRADEARPYVEEALATRRAAAGESASPADLVKCADLLLTAAIVDLRNPQEALDLARRANDLTEEKDAAYLHTLALAWHRAGDRRKAIEAEQKALDRLPPRSGLRPDYEAKLAEYRAGGTG